MLANTPTLLNDNDDLFSNSARIDSIDSFTDDFWSPWRSPLTSSSISSPDEPHSPAFPSTTPLPSSSLVVASEVTCSDAKSLRRLKHRTLDAQRRTRESAAVERIDALVSADKRDRASLLESAADTISSLQRALAEKDRQLNAATALATNRKRARADDVAVNERRRAPHPTVLRDSFFACVFACSSVLQLIFNADRGVLLFANRSSTGFDAIAGQIVGRRCYAPRSEWLLKSAEDVDNDSYCRQLNVQVNGQSVAMSQSNLEYKRAISQLYRGEISAADTEFQTPNITSIPIRWRAKIWMSSTRASDRAANVHLLHMIAQPAHEQSTLQQHDAT